MEPSSVSDIVPYLGTVSNRVIFRFFLYVLYSTLLHLPPLRFHYIGRMLETNPGQLQLWHRQSNALTARLDLLHSFYVFYGGRFFRNVRKIFLLNLRMLLVLN
jgi:hypothetical protein